LAKRSIVAKKIVKIFETLGNVDQQWLITIFLPSLEYKSWGLRHAFEKER